VPVVVRQNLDIVVEECRGVPFCDRAGQVSGDRERLCGVNVKMQ
jgi:hypothetical protein